MTSITGVSMYAVARLSKVPTKISFNGFRSFCVSLTFTATNLEAILGDDTDNSGTLRLIVDVDNGNATGAGLEHLATCFVERAFGMDGYGLYGCNTEGSLDICGGQNEFQTAGGMSIPRRLFSRN